MRTIPVIAILCGISFAGAANADSPYVGHCQEDASIPPGNILSACEGFINQAYQENWQLEYVPQALVYEAIADERLGKDEEAEKTLKATIKKYPDFPLAWERLGELLEKQKGGGVLMATLDAMIQANPQNPEVLSSACWFRARVGEQLDAAIADCNESLRLKPGGVNGLTARAFAYFQNQKYPEAIADANAALGTDPKLAAPLYVRGQAELKSGNAAAGAADIAAAKAINDKIADRFEN